MSNLISPLGRQNNRQISILSSQVRPARVRFFVNSRGLGTSKLSGDTGLAFNTYFTDEPTVYWGLRSMRNISEQNSPLATVTVTDYRTNDRGLYTGAEVVIRTWHPAFIYDPDLLNVAEFSFRFSLTFEGFALRSTAGV